MIKLQFKRGRSTSESFVIKVDKPLSYPSVDFVRQQEHNIASIELKAAGITMSDVSGELFMADRDIHLDRQKFTATEFIVKPTQATLGAITEQTTFELIANGSDFLAEVSIEVI